MKKTTTRTARQVKTPAPTLLRTYRFDTKLVAAFEADCGRQLRNPRTVLEALMRRWLAATAEERDGIAAYHQRSGRRNGKPIKRP